MTYSGFTLSTPIGPFSIATNDEGAITATAFGDLNRLESRLHRCHVLRDNTPIEKITEQVHAYFRGDITSFSLPLAPAGTQFQQTVWAALRQIPFGETRTYAGIASAIGNTGAARAVGRANATNPICLIVPCHRVIGSDGSLTGFAFGEALKRRLLEHEGAFSTTHDLTPAVTDVTH